jgi:hypothetical protein
MCPNGRHSRPDTSHLSVKFTVAIVEISSVRSDDDEPSLVSSVYVQQNAVAA